MRIKGKLAIGSKSVRYEGYKKKVPNWTSKGR